jgi:adrenodoxin-NADP+ reductase
LAEIIVKGSSSKVDDASKTWSLDYCLSPTEFIGDSNGTINSTVFELTSLSSPYDPSSKVSGTGKTLKIPSAVAFRSIGYKSVALPEFSEAGILFEDRNGVIQNDGLGRVFTQGEKGSLTHYNGLYCAGWVKRGPTGVIASTMQDAFSTGDAIAADWTAESPFLNAERCHGWEGLKHDADVSNCKIVGWEGWHKIDSVERERGRLAGKVREKFTSTAEMLSVASQNT